MRRRLLIALVAMAVLLPLAAAAHDIGTTAASGQSGHLPGADADAMTAYLVRDDLGPAVVALALLLAFGLGAVHALSPGHGKTVTAAYLVGSRGTVRHACLLGLIVTATHVSSVLVFGAIALWASEVLMPEQLYPWLETGAGLLIAGIGAALLVTRLRQRTQRDHVQQHHAHDQHHHEHHHEHDHQHHHEHDHHHTAGGHTHVPLDERGQPVSLTQLFVLGVTGGMIPCASTTVVLLTAIALHRIALGLLLIVMFSAGLATVLIVIGIIVVKARDRLEHFAPARGWLGHLPLVSALVVTLLGLGIALLGLRNTGIL